MAYAITIHKSQGLSLDSALLNIGSLIFSKGQAYVALSRVKTLNGVYLINLDPSQIKAQESSIVEYNRLQTLYRPDLPTLSISRKSVKRKIFPDNKWAIQSYISTVLENIEIEKENKSAKRKLKKKR